MFQATGSPASPFKLLSAGPTSPASGQAFVYEHNARQYRYEGPWQVVNLPTGVTARAVHGDGSSFLKLPWVGCGIIVHFWAHPAGGAARIEVDGRITQEVNLESSEAHYRRVYIGAVRPGKHELVIRASHGTRPDNSSDQVIFYQVIGYAPGGRDAVQAQASPAENRPLRFGAIENPVVQMTWAERVVLYATVFGLRPQRCLEIGTCWGGSSIIIVAALDDVGSGKLVCVDPAPSVAVEHWQRFAHRSTLLTGSSPDILPLATKEAGGSFDFALIDGDHEYPGVVRDIEGVLPVLSDSAHLLFHDAHHEPVRRAIDDMVHKHTDCLIDCGMLSTEATADSGAPGVLWGGLRLLRHACRAA